MRYFLLIILACISVQAQDLTNNVVRFTKLPPSAVDTTSVKPMMRTASDGRLRIMSWSALSSLVGGGGGTCDFTEEQCERLKDLVYSNNSSFIQTLPSSGERGITTAVTVRYQINPNDDVFTSASINQGIGAVLYDNAPHDVSGGNRSQDITYTLTKNFTRNGSAATETQSTTYITLLPQFYGVSTNADLSGITYTAISGVLTKTVQQPVQNIISTVSTNNSQYVYFITATSSGLVKDNNNFTYPIGAWGDTSGAVYFWRKPFTITLNDNSTATLYLIRSAVVPTVNLNNFTFTYIP